MIPMARDAVSMIVYRRVVKSDRGDVIESWEQSEDRVLVSAYPLSSARTQTEDGQDARPQHRLLFALRPGLAVSAGDRLGDVCGPVWHLTDVKVADGRASCVGVRLRCRTAWR